MKPFKKIKVDFDYQQLRRDVEQTFIKNKESALGTELADISHRNQCITVSKPDSDEWYDGIAGKTYSNNQQQRYDLKTQFENETNEFRNK